MEEPKFGNGKHRKKPLTEEEDRLSTLPDPILTDILSLLPFNTAVATSVLSRRWRNLWTGVTSFELHYPNRKFTSSTHRILSQLTSPTIRKFSLTCDKNTWQVFLRDLSYEIACFPLVRNRNVEQIRVSSHRLFVPACIFQCQTLVTLELEVTMSCKFAIVTTVDLPNVKRLGLFCGLLDSFRPIANLFRSCPRLEDLCLAITLLHDISSIEICAPNLKLLSVTLTSTPERNEIIIDAPMLADLKVTDGSSLYRFARYPSRLVTACIDLRHEPNRWESGGMGATICLHGIAKFVGGLSSVSNLQLKSNAKLFTYLDSAVDGGMPVFHNLSCFKTTLNRHLDVDDFLLSLQCAPNLEDLEVTVENSPVLNFRHWCVPGCFSSKLKTVKIWGLQGYDDEVSLLEFILKYAVVLEELQIMVCIDFGVVHRDDEVRKGEHKFCDAFFKLPRSSSTLKLVFSGEHISATSNAVE